MWLNVASSLEGLTKLMPTIAGELVVEIFVVMVGFTSSMGVPPVRGLLWGRTKVVLAGNLLPRSRSLSAEIVLGVKSKQFVFLS